MNGALTSYTYDLLGRLETATRSGQWSQLFEYDGFGNLIKKTKGPTTVENYPADLLTNRRTEAGTYDAAGNHIWNPSVVYDSDNRMVAAPGGSLGTVETYEYAPDNRRVVQRTGTGAATVTLWIGSERVATADTDYILFAGRRFRAPLGADPAAEGADRLGSTADHRPYGENATGKFATYERDGTTGLDYADQRYYQPGAGRFMTADPYLASGGVESPGSWNRYAYVEGDPVNWVDPSWPREMPGRCDMCSSDSSHARSRADENGSVLSSSREWNCVGWA